MKYLLILLTILPISIYGQNNENNTNKKLLIGLSLSPDHSFRVLDAESTMSAQLIAAERDDKEIPRIGFTAGITALYKLNDRITVEGGVYFSDKGEKTKEISVFNLPPTPPTTVRYTYHYQYLDIPLKLNYYVLNNKLRLFLSGGLSTNIFLNHKTITKTELPNGSTESDSETGEDLEPLNFAAIVGIGIDSELNEKLNIRLEPVYRRSINSIVEKPIIQYLYSIGLNIGLFYAL